MCKYLLDIGSQDFHSMNTTTLSGRTAVVDDAMVAEDVDGHRVVDPRGLWDGAMAITSPCQECFVAADML